MDNDDDKKTAYKFLIGGIFFVLFGAWLLLWTTGYLSVISIVLPVVLCCFGGFLLYMVFGKEAHDIYLIPAVVSILLGIFLLAKKIIVPSGELARVWPLFMTAAGLAMALFAFRHHGSSRIKLLVPSASLILLSFIFLPFSLGLSRISFRKFVITWWPVLILLIGVLSIVLHFRNSRKNKGE